MTSISAQIPLRVLITRTTENDIVDFDISMIGFNTHL